MSPDRAALIRSALATHRAKRRQLERLGDQDRSLLEALAFETLFFPSARGDLGMSEPSAPKDAGKTVKAEEAAPGPKRPR